MDAPLRLPREGDTVGGHFRLHSVIGRGSFGVVYQAEQLGLDRQVAVKMLLPHVVTNAAIVDRFKREARLASSLKSPHSVAIHGFGDHNGVPYLVMEFLRGMDLRSYLVQRRTLAVNETCAILQQALRSLGEAHELGIIHRDLKPENLFLSSAPGGGFLVKVLDFGIAKAIDGDWGQQTMVQLTREGMVCGTPEYMSPEQATGEPVLTPGVDIYSMGCIAYEMIAGRMPYEGNSPMDVALKHLTHPLPRLQGELEGTFIESLIHKAMAKESADRFQTVYEFSAAIDDAIHAHGLRAVIGAEQTGQERRTSSVFERALDRAEIPTAPSDRSQYAQHSQPEPPPPVRSKSALERPFLLLAIAAAAMLLGLMTVILVVAVYSYKPAMGETNGTEPPLVAEGESPEAPDDDDSAAVAEPDGGTTSVDAGSAVVVEISSTPDGASVVGAEGKEICVTPCSFEVDSETSIHKFKVKKEGFDEGLAIVDIRKTLYDAVALRESAEPATNDDAPAKSKQTARRATKVKRTKKKPATETKEKATKPATTTDTPAKKSKKEKKFDVPVWQ